jgi:hypothetical protein
MAGSGLRPARRVNAGELERSDTNFPGSGRTHWESTQPFNVGPLRPSKGTPNDERETTNVSAESVESVDADDFRMWWEQGSAPKEAVRGRWKLTPKGRALVGVVAIVASFLALKGWAPSFSFAYNDPAHTQFPDDNCSVEQRRRTSGEGQRAAGAGQGRQGTTGRSGRTSVASAASRRRLGLEKFSQRLESQTRRLVRKRSTPPR